MNKTFNSVIKALEVIEGVIELPVSQLPSACSDIKRASQDFITDVMASNSIMPAVTYFCIEGEVLFYWKSGGVIIEVELSTEGPHFCWIKVDGTYIESLHDPDEIVDVVRSILHTATDRANEANPQWKTQYLESSF